MCNCISELEENLKALAEEKGMYKKPIKSVSMAGKTLSIGGNQLNSVVVHDFEIELEGQKKRKTIKIKHSHCPFCGEKK